MSPGNKGVSRRDEGVAARCLAVRERLRVSQADFVDRLNRVSMELFGDDGPLFNQGRVSRLELGTQRASLDDVAIYARLDPDRRGKLWLGWDEPVDASMVTPRRHGPSVIQNPPDEAVHQPVPRKKPGRRRA